MSGVRKSFGKQFNVSSGFLDLIIKSWSERTAEQCAPHLGFALKMGQNHLMQMIQVVLSFCLNISERLVVSFLLLKQLVQLCHLFSQQSMDLP